MRDPGGVTVTLSRMGVPGEVRVRLVVGADGIRGSVARWFGFPPVDEIVSAYEAELSGCHVPAGRGHMIPMFAGRAQAPGFFSWIIPVGGDRTRSGLAVAPGMNEHAAKAYFERMFTDPASAPYLAGAKPTYLIIGGIPLGSYAGEILADLLCGRAGPWAALTSRRAVPTPPEPLRWLAFQSIHGWLSAIDRRVDAQVDRGVSSG